MFWDSVVLYRALEQLEPDVVMQRVACAYTGVAAFYCARHGASLIWHVSAIAMLSRTHTCLSGAYPGSSTWLSFDTAYGTRQPS